MPAKHHRLIIDKLEAVARGEIRRLMLFLPPGSAKSTYASDLFPAWWLAQKPNRLIVAASNTSGLASSFSRRVRGRVRSNGADLGYGLLREAEDNWTTTNGCEYRAVGVGSSIAGRRADLGLIDDPTRSREEADSATQREKVWNWYIDDFLTRLKPGAPEVLIGTRWHEDDLFGRILKHQPDLWHVLKVPAIAGEDDALGRKPGEYLWADDQYGYAQDLAEKKARSLPRTWASLYQQEPRTEGGEILKAEWWRAWPVGDPKADPGAKPLPSPDYIIVSIDTAYTAKDENDPTACTVWWVCGGDDERSIALLRYAWAKRLEFPELKEEIEATLSHFAIPGVPIRLLVEAKASGLSVVQELRRRMPDLSIWEIQPKGDKVARAYAVQSMFEAERVFHAATADGETKGWAQAVIDECAAFPRGTHDDRVDSVTQALRHVRDSGVVFMPEDDPPEPTLRSVLRTSRRMYGGIGTRQ
jgi:predicted phage terminase large subunit-like protein